MQSFSQLIAAFSVGHEGLYAQLLTSLPPMKVPEATDIKNKISIAIFSNFDRLIKSEKFKNFQDKSM